MKSKAVKNSKASVYSYDQMRAYSKISNESEYSRMSKDVVLDISHIFHDNCLRDWLIMNGRCPICNLEVEKNNLIMKKADDEEGEFTAIANKLLL